MAKMFYTLEEAKSVLGRTEEDIKQFAREGRLREFRDGPRLMFKADQVEQLRSELSSGDQVDLGVSDSGGMIDLVDTTGASGTSITLSDTRSGQGTRFGEEVAGSGLKTKDDTALAADLGLSGSVSGIPSPGRPSGTGLSGTSAGSRGGINVFGSEEIPGAADPSAQTAISPLPQEINLESVGSGSGLLDLGRHDRDDTSLGAVLEEMPSGRPEDTGITGGVELEEPRGGIDRGPVVPVYVQAPDPWAAAFGAAALGGALVVLFGLFALISGVEGTLPDSIHWLFEKQQNNAPLVALIIGFVVVILLFAVGAFVGRTVTARTAR